MIYSNDPDISNTALIISNDDIIKLKNNINNINKIILYTNVDYDNEFKKNDFFIDKEIELDFTNFRRNDTFDFSKILNTNKIKKIKIAGNACIVGIEQFNYLEYIIVCYNIGIDLYSFVHSHKSYPKNLKIFEIINPTYNNTYLTQYDKSEKLFELFKIFESLNLNLDKIIINEKVYNHPLMNKNKTQYYNTSNNNDSSSNKNDDNNKSRNKISNKVCYYNSSTNTNDTLNNITVDNIVYITYYLLHLKID